jgi:hypothetical protein
MVAAVEPAQLRLKLTKEKKIPGRARVYKGVENYLYPVFDPLS